MEYNSAQNLAMWRFGLIAPVINGTFDEATKSAYYRKVCADNLTLPDGMKVSYSPYTLAWWEQLYRKEGFEALMPRRRSDKGYSRKLSIEAKDAILALKKQFPKINATMIYEQLIKEGIICAKDVSLSTIQRFVRTRLGDMQMPVQVKDRKAFEAERVLTLWQADTLYGPFVEDGNKKKRAYLISIIDDKSRMLVGGRFFFSDNALNVQKVFKDAVLRFGIPEKLLADNGSPYRNDQLSAICGRLGCVLIHAQPRDGAAKGKIERLNKTCRMRFLSVLTKEQTTSLDALNDAYLTWAMSYNTQKHSVTDKAPMDAYRKEMDTVRMPKSAEWVHACFLNRVLRTVKGDATVQIENTLYDVPMQFINTKVEICFSPDDMTSAYIVSEGRTWPMHLTDKVANFKTRRTTSPYLIDYSRKGGDSDVATALPTCP
jgi:hypothetical protein